MVISKKPLHFIVATLVAFLPLITVANPTTDTTAVETHDGLKTEQVSHGNAHAAPTDQKTKIKDFINNKDESRNK